ncbi:hypothetical protein PVMG_03636 [Plasmodium vivax Mauritania I]|uniref:Uncharacterized protein n=1 Tax=Plasmodium vivax Mauritania I TaxID=1035515 RepID=A0A0J9TB99_PLAVI|nr:hypothetical protein PVMG_03636 [Plasmodium vivax Mauritania I]
MIIIICKFQILSCLYNKIEKNMYEYKFIKKFHLLLKFNEFEPICATKVFKTTYTSWHNISEQYLDHINKINDPILKYISLYFVQYYMYGHKYYHKSKNDQINAACTYLNGWLLEKKDLFTFGKNCNTKLNSFNDNIKTLWNMLTKDPNFFDKYEKPWCKDYNKTLETTFPSKVIVPKCDEIIPQKPFSNVLTLPSDQTKFSCPPCQNSAISPQTDQLSGTDRTKNLAVTSGFTAVGTLGTLFFLYRVINKQ